MGPVCRAVLGRTLRPDVSVRQTGCMTSSPTARRVVPAEHRAPRGALPALAVDLLLTVLFVALGQGQHSTERGLLGLLVTAAPFLAGLLLMTGLTSGHRTWARVWPHGVIVWLGTVAVGMVLRVAFGLGGAPVSFVLVALGVLGVLLLGRRAVTAWLVRRTRR